MLVVALVRDSLALEPYLIAAIGSRDIDSEYQRDEWKLRTFLEAANLGFVERVELGR